MIWHNDTERARACRALLVPIRLHHFWDEKGPTKTGLAYKPPQIAKDCDEDRAASEYGVLSSGERIMVKLAWDLWNSRGGCEFGSILDTLDGTLVATIARFLAAWSMPDHGAMGRFIDEQEAKSKLTRPRP